MYVPPVTLCNSGPVNGNWGPFFSCAKACMALEAAGGTGVPQLIEQSRLLPPPLQKGVFRPVPSSHHPRSMRDFT